MYVAVAQAYYLTGNNKESVRVMNELLANLEHKGTVPKEQQLLLVVAACQRANDNVCVGKVFEKLVVYYPKAEYWQNLLVALKNSDTDDIQKLNVMRLSVYVKVLKKPEDYKEMAQLALENKLACESQAVLEQGFAQKVFVEKRDIDVNTRLLAAAKKEAETDKAALAQERRCGSRGGHGRRRRQSGRAIPGLRRSRQGRRDHPARHLKGRYRARATPRKPSSSMRPACCWASRTCEITTRPKPPRRFAR